MQPNWSKLEALGRTLIILFASTFFGALVLPLAANGELPVTWVAWRPILAVAVSAAIVAEVVWIRAHLAAAAAARGLGGSSAAPALPAAPADVGKGGQAGFVSIGLALGLSCLIAIVAMVACTKQQASQADTVAIDLTNAVCSAIEGQPAGQPWVDIVCTVAGGVEQGIGAVVDDAGVPRASSSIRVVRLRLPAGDAQAFLAAHAAKH